MTGKSFFIGRGCDWQGLVVKLIHRFHVKVLRVICVATCDCSRRAGLTTATAERATIELHRVAYSFAWERVFASPAHTLDPEAEAAHHAAQAGRRDGQAQHHGAQLTNKLMQFNETKPILTTMHAFDSIAAR